MNRNEDPQKGCFSQAAVKVTSATSEPWLGEPLMLVLPAILPAPSFLLDRMAIVICISSSGDRWQSTQ